MATGYSKVFMPFSAVKEKDFLSRSMGFKGVGLGYVRCKPARARPTCTVTSCRKKCLSRSRETVRSFSMASGLKCRKEGSFASVRKCGARWATI
jgi:hypothetical protein